MRLLLTDETDFHTVRSPAGFPLNTAKNCYIDKSRHCSSSVFRAQEEDGRSERMSPLKHGGEEQVRRDLEPFFPPKIPIPSFFIFFATFSIVLAPTKHRRAHFLLCRSVLALSTRGELRGKRRPPWGLLSWCARLVTFPSQFSIIHRAPVCHVPVPSVCPKQGPPAERLFYNDILTSSGSDSPETCLLMPCGRNAWTSSSH